MSKKISSIILGGVCAVLALFFLALRNSPQTAPPGKPDSARAIPMESYTPKGAERLLRYDSARDPKTSPEAARAYYSRREKMIRDFRGDEWIDKPLRVLKDSRASRSDLLTAIDFVRRLELIEGLPSVAALLSHDDPIVVSDAARALCWFGDKRGFDFVMSQMEGPDSEKWWGMFEKDFAKQNPTEYLPRIRALLTSKSGSRVDVYVTALVLAQLGEADSARYLIPVIEREPQTAVDTILKLTNVRDPGITTLMQKLSKEGSTNKVQHAADVVLANQGDAAAQQRLLEAARRVTGLPQPQNADGTNKPGMMPKFFGKATPAWDGDAVFALEHGMQTLAPEQAVPALRDIAIRADNVRFSKTAIELLAKIGNEAARNALWEVARSVQGRKRTYEDTLFTTTGKALMLFADETSAKLATIMFSGDKHGMEVSQLLAESRGWDGLFKLALID